MAYKTRLDRSGRVVLPAEARRALRISAGDALSIKVEGGSLVLRTLAGSVGAARAQLHGPLGADTAMLTDDIIALRREGLW